MLETKHTRVPSLAAMEGKRGGVQNLLFLKLYFIIFNFFNLFSVFVWDKAGSKEAIGLRCKITPYEERTKAWE